MNRTKTRRFLRGFYFYMREKPDRIETMLNPHKKRELRDGKDHTIEGQRAAQRILNIGLNQDPVEIMHLQNIALEIDYLLGGLKQIPIEPCASCQFIAFCKEHSMTCSVFRGYVHKNQPELAVRVPDKHWSDSWRDDDHTPEGGNNEASNTARL